MTLIGRLLAILLFFHAIPAFAISIAVVTHEGEGRIGPSLEVHEGLVRGVSKGFGDGALAGAVASSLEFQTNPKLSAGPDDVPAMAAAAQAAGFDAVLVLAAYARAVEHPLTKIPQLQATVTGTLYETGAGRVLFSDFEEIDPSGQPLTGCAAGPSPEPACVRTQVSNALERLSQAVAQRAGFAIGSLLR